MSDVQGGDFLANKIEWLDIIPVNLHTFEAVLKVSQLLFWSFWSNSAKYLTVSILGSYKTAFKKRKCVNVLGQSLCVCAQ